jgi:hypothetical protein
METLEHSGIAITMDIYAHVIPQKQRESAGRMATVLRWRGLSSTDRRATLSISRGRGLLTRVVVGRPADDLRARGAAH